MMRIPRAWSDWFDLPRALVWIAVIGGGHAFFVWTTWTRGGSPLRAMWLAPFVGLALAPALVALVSGYVGWALERAWASWQGVYHAFDDHQIRVVEARGALWFASDDVHAALSMRPRAAVLKAMSTAECRDDPDAGTMLSNAGLARLFGRSTERRALRLVAWADGDVRRVWQKKRDLQAAGPVPDVPPRA